MKSRANTKFRSGWAMLFIPAQLWWVGGTWAAVPTPDSPTGAVERTRAR